MTEMEKVMGFGETMLLRLCMAANAGRASQKAKCKYQKSKCPEGGRQQNAAGPKTVAEKVEPPRPPRERRAEAQALRAREPQ